MSCIDVFPLYCSLFVAVGNGVSRYRRIFYHKKKRVGVRVNKRACSLD